jgi:hypothetical protein
MKSFVLIMFAIALLTACGGGGGEPYAESDAPAEAAPVHVKVDPREPREVPAAKEAASDEDWPAKVHNKNIEIVQVLNIIEPVADYIVAGFNQYGDRFSPTLQEEWQDTQHQLTAALGLYEDCNKRMEAGSFDKQLFLDMEEVWQLLVKTGVAGVRTKQMIDEELGRMMG